MAITQHYLPAADTWVNHSYEVTRIHRLRPHSASGSYDFTTDLGDIGKYLGGPPALPSS